ncbi:MAG: FAD-dependent oxidoreductase, partial [Chloroflexota bacterium]
VIDGDFQQCVLSHLHISKELQDLRDATDSRLVRWQYASPITTHPNEILCNGDQTLIFAGDAFGGRGRIEGAYISGKAAAHAVIESMQPVSD